MDTLDEWFPYPDYRPYQRQMLENAAVCAREGGVVMIDAPTGSGKSSVVSALLSERNGRKVVVAVRTISQLNTFIRELELVRSKRPGLKVAYLIGKRMMCPLSGEGNIYRKCEGVKSFSLALMRERAQKGSLVPSKDPVIRQQIRNMDSEHPLICPYFINSRIFLETEKGLKMFPSTALKSKSDRVTSERVWPQDLLGMSGGVCPYEMMLNAAQRADVILLNYHHLFHDDIRDQLYASLGLNPSEICLILDEAHNCGDVMQGIQSVSLQESSLEQARRELRGLRRNMKGIDAIHHVLPRIEAFMDGLKNSHETEDWFDPAIFERMVVKESLYPDISSIVDDLMHISERIRETNMKAGEFKETSIENLTEFLFRITQSSADPSFLTVYRRDEDGIILEVRNIDPARKMQEMVVMHHCCVLISGTFSPVESYRRYYFEDLPVTVCSLPNTFPKENRLLVCAGDITTAYSKRQDKKNLSLISQYIKEFSRIKGNIAIYFPSYQILELFSRDLQSGAGNKRLFVESKDSGEARDLLRQFMELPRTGRAGLLLAVCGGKWSEGLDYRGDLLNGAMVIGLPLAPFNRVRRMVIDYFRHKFGDEGEFISYTLPAMNRAEQAIGRVLRTPEDTGILVLGEKRFLEARIHERLPAWMREELRECDIAAFREALSRWR